MKQNENRIETTWKQHETTWKQNGWKMEAEWKHSENKLKT